MISIYVFVFVSKPNQTRQAKTWSTWTSRLSWSQRTASHSQSSWLPPQGRRSLHGPATSARHVNMHHSLQQSDERQRMSAESLHVIELTNIFSVLSFYFYCICSTVHRQHPVQWVNDECLWRQLQSHCATDDQVIFSHAIIEDSPFYIYWQISVLLHCVFFPSRSDSSLYCDDVDIRFSKMMNSCKVLQIRYASVERLLERLTDLRFLSIDFLNTFLHSYRVFTTADVVLDKLITIYKKPISAIPARWVTLHLEKRECCKTVDSIYYGQTNRIGYVWHPSRLYPAA